MSSYQQRQAVKQFMQFTAAPENVALLVLRRTQFDINAATNYYFENSYQFQHMIPKSGDKNALGKLFDKYTDKSDTSRMSDQGMMDYYKAINLDPNGIMTFVVPHVLEMKVPMAITRAEFREGWAKLGISDARGMASHLSKITSKYTNPRTGEFQMFYKWIFNYLKSEDRKSIDRDNAVLVWGLMFAKYPLGKKWIEFVEKTEDAKAITSDLWINLLSFLNETQPDLSNFEDDGAWPVLIDQFVEYMTEGAQS